MRLKNKICLVTGGATGIGRATARLFAEEGAIVVIADINEDAGTSAEEEASKTGTARMFASMNSKTMRGSV